MGWALGIKQWLRPLDVYDSWDFESPDREGYINELLFDNDDNEELVRTIMENKDVEALIKVWGLQFATLEEINNEDITLIAFREKNDFALDDYGHLCVEDTDFHFRKRINGIWTEKLGGAYIRICDDSVDSDVWYGGYDDIYFILLKKINKRSINRGIYGTFKIRYSKRLY